MLFYCFIVLYAHYFTLIIKKAVRKQPRLYGMRFFSAAFYQESFCVACLIRLMFFTPYSTADNSIIAVQRRINIFEIWSGILYQII